MKYYKIKWITPRYPTRYPSYSTSFAFGKSAEFCKKMLQDRYPSYAIVEITEVPDLQVPDLQLHFDSVIVNTMKMCHKQAMISFGDMAYYKEYNDFQI